MDKKRKYRPDTQLCRLGRNPAAHHGIVNPPVYHASTILFESLEAAAQARRDPMAKGRSTYGRTGTPTTFALEEAVAELEGGYGAVATPGGLAAIAGALLTYVAQGDHILVSDSAYLPTRRLCEDLLARMGVETTCYDPCIGDGIADLMRPNTKLVFLESPGSHTFEMQDVPAIAGAARAAGVVSIIDNTWATPLFFRPLDHGVDVSLHAATKYLCGHSDVMMGIIVAGKEHYHRIRRTVAMLGYSAGPDDVYLTLRGLRTLSVRLHRHQETGLRLARWLQARPEVARVLHPGLPDDPGHTLWRRDFGGASGLFGVVLKPASQEAIAAMVDGLALFGIGASWGGFESLILQSQNSVVRTATEWPEAPYMLRLHAGLEDPEDLIADLEAGFDRLTAAAPTEAKGAGQ
jgi:cystathionine beta-lyase